MRSSNLHLHIDIKRLPGNEEVPLPAYQTAGAAGMDMHACVTGPVVLPPGKVVPVPCGFTLAIPSGFEAQVRPRSGLALTHAVTIANAPGTIDADYRGEVKVLLINLGDTPFEVTRGMRIAQLVIAPVQTVEWREVAELPASERGPGGFGHTGR
jgi:dUTP pyrophosphatase